MPDRRTTVLNWYETTLTGQMGPTDLVAEVAATAPIVAPVIVVIEADSPTQREVILFDGTVTSSELHTTSLANRYQSGSAAASGLTHPAGSTVRLVVLAQHVDDLNDRVDAVDADLTGFAADLATDVANLANHISDFEDHSARHAQAGPDPLVADSVVEATIVDASVTTAKLAAAAVTTPQLADEAVSTAKIEDLAVTAAKLADGTITPDKLIGTILGEADSPLRFHTTQNTSSATSLSTSFQTIAGVTFQIPWSTYFMLMWAQTDLGGSWGTGGGQGGEGGTVEIVPAVNASGTTGINRILPGPGGPFHFMWARHGSGSEHPDAGGGQRQVEVNLRARELNSGMTATAINRFLAALLIRGS